MNETTHEIKCARCRIILKTNEEIAEHIQDECKKVRKGSRMKPESYYKKKEILWEKDE